MSIPSVNNYKIDIKNITLAANAKVKVINFSFLIFKKQKKYPSKVAIPDKKQTKIFICITN